MSERIDLTGQKFGRLTAIKFSHFDKWRRSYWLCKCDCGNEKIINSRGFKNGSTKSCGCIRRLELTGQRFGRLIVIEFSHFNKRGNSCWLCKCDCGNHTTPQGSNLKYGDTKSCGCLQKEMASKAGQLPEGIAARNKVIVSHKNNAKRKNIEQALTDKQIIAIHKRNCHYCGALPSNTISGAECNGSYTYSGIDRVDNNKGYTTDNSVPCCAICNHAKNNLTYNEFMNWLKQIHSHLIKSSNDA